MRKLLAGFPLLLLFCTGAGATEGEYAVNRIPAALLKDAHAVKRSEQMIFEINSDKRATYRHKIAFTILDEQGDKWAYFGEGYDKLRSIESFEGTLYDAAGKKIKSLKKSDIKDVSGSDESSLADDSRAKWHNFFHKVYPYTVEYEIEIRYKGTMFIPAWSPVNSSLLSVEQSQLTIICPSDNPLRYKMFNYPGEPSVSDNKSTKIYTWEVKQLPALIKEYAAPAWHQVTPTVFLASEQFVLDDYEGSNASWKDFGRFVYDLKKQRDALPDEVKQKVRELTAGINDEREKISELYKFLQQNTRYISIQLGIGGWQPYDAKYVSNKKYGDCKALSNFMYSLLKEAGIRSVYTVTYRGDDPDYLLADLPSSQFNHVILFVPLVRDTVWLECTSQSYAAGYLGGDNSNRYALAVDENGGTLVRTPGYGLNDNLQQRKISGVLSDDGSLNVNVQTRYSAQQQDDIHHIINQLSKEKVKELLHEQLDFATYDINKFDYKEESGTLPAINESLDITVSNYATITGKRLFIVPNVMTRTYRKLTPDTARKFDIVFNMNYRDIDSVEIALPDGFAPESMPQDVSINSPFGKYASSVKLAGNKLVYTRLIERYSGRFPASQYEKLVLFMDAVYKADRNRVVLVKK